jgi:hypothetical protein
MAKYAGISYDEMLRMILQAAERRLKLYDESGFDKSQGDSDGAVEELASCKG